MELIDKLGSNHTTNIGILPSASKHVSNKSAYQCLHIIDNKEILNGLKGSTKTKNRESLFKYQSRIYNVKRNSYVTHRGMKMNWNNRLSPSLNVIKPYVSKGLLRNYNNRSDTRLGPGII